MWLQNPNHLVCCICGQPYMTWTKMKLQTQPDAVIQKMTSDLKLKNTSWISGSNEQTRYHVSVGMSFHLMTLNRGSERIDLVDAYFSWKALNGLWLTGGVQSSQASWANYEFSDLVLQRCSCLVWMVPNREVGCWGITRRYTIFQIEHAGVFNGMNQLLGDDNAGKCLQDVLSTP